MSENGNIDVAEKIVQLFETMMKSLDDIHHEKTYSNHKEVWKIQEEVFDPARKELVQLLRDLIGR